MTELKEWTNKESEIINVTDIDVTKWEWIYSYDKKITTLQSFYPLEWSIKTLPILNIFKLKSLMMSILILVDIWWNLLTTGIMRSGTLITSGSAII